MCRRMIQWTSFCALTVLLWLPASAGAAPQQASQKGMDYLMAAAANWQGDNERCFACHIQGMTMWGAAVGRGRGYEVNPNRLASLVELMTDTQTSDGWWAYEGEEAKRLTTAVATSGLAYYDRFVASDAQESLLRGAEWLLSQQAEDGSWPSDSPWSVVRSEIYREHEHYVTAMCVIAVARAHEITQSRIYEVARDRGAEWLKSVETISTQGLSFKLIGLSEGRVPLADQALAATRSRLLFNQNLDGGFGPFAGHSSTSYHTGLAIYALRLGGMIASDRAITRGIQWLLRNQLADGSWPRGHAHLEVTDLVAPSMWPVIALGEFGDVGVSISASPDEHEVDVFVPTEQVVAYTITVSNTSSGNKNDTFALRLSGGMPGFTAMLSADLAGASPIEEVTLAPGASQDMFLLVTVPANLPPGLPLVHTVIARSDANPGVHAAASVTTYTPPAPPIVGRSTTTEFLAGAGQSVAVNDPIRFAAQVRDTVIDEVVRGNGMGVVTFFVGGAAVGSDDDADGDGVFETTWAASTGWPHMGNQSVLAVYSGVDLPAPAPDLAPSFAVDGIEISCGSGLWGACTPDCPCAHGTGDCDSDDDCAGEGRCLHDAGAAFGYEDPEVDVCSIGCPVLGVGAWNFCSPECPCSAGEGDCDSDSDCESGLKCMRDVGPAYGYDRETDVCEIL